MKPIYILAYNEVLSPLETELNQRPPNKTSSKELRDI